jgi:hypothetical protein
MMMMIVVSHQPPPERLCHAFSVFVLPSRSPRPSQQQQQQQQFRNSQHYYWCRSSMELRDDDAVSYRSFHHHRHMATSGDGNSDTEWVQALFEASGESQKQRDFESDMKMKGLMKGTVTTNPKLTANANLIRWLQQEGRVYLSEVSSWGEAPHPLAISTETKDEITNESSGRGLLARRDINDGDELIKIPIHMCLTKAAARRVLGNDIVVSGMNDYIAMALHLMYEQFVQGEQSFWKPYLDVLPDDAIDEVNPTFLWNDDDLNYLQGSPVIAATQSMQMKVRRKSFVVFPKLHPFLYLTCSIQFFIYICI